MGKLSENTLIPIGLAVLVIGGGSAWLTTMHVNLSALAAEVASIEDDRKTISGNIQKIHQDISEIKGELKRINR